MERKGGVKIAVLGAGAIGSLVAGYLTNKNEEVILVGRPEQCEVIFEQGLQIEGVRGNLLVDLSIKLKLDEKVELAILATKTQDLRQIISDNLEYIQDARILSVQNGIRADEIIKDELSTNSLFSSIVMFGATYLKAGEVVHNFEGDWILGALNPKAKEEILKVNKITSQIFPSPVADDVISMKWLKVFLNANNCLAAILGKSMQDAFSDKNICKISLSIWREAWGVVKRANIKISSLPNFPLERLKGLIAMPVDKSAEIFSRTMQGLSKEPLYGSVLQSIKRHRPSEIDYINGEFLKLTKNPSCDAPLNQRLVLLVHSVEKNKQFLNNEDLVNQTKEFLK